MPVPVRIVKVLAGGALVEFTDGSTRLVVTETVAAWKRFGLAVNEGMMLNPDEVALYKRIVEEFPHYSGLPEEEVAPEVIPEVIEDVPDAAIVPEVTAESELRTGHFGQGWMPDFGHNAKVLYLRELERARNKNITRLEILDKEPDNVELEKLVTEIVEGRPVYGDTSEDWRKYGIDPYKDSTPEALLAKKLGISLYPDGEYRPLPPDVLATKDLPTTIKAAQRMGLIFYRGRKGKKKIAITASQLATFELSMAYKKGDGSALSQARKWMESQIAAGNPIDFKAVGGASKKILNETWDELIDADAIKVDLTKSDFEDKMGDWTAAHDLRAQAKRKWEAGIRPTGDVQAEWDKIVSEPEMGTWTAADDLRSRAKRKSEAGIELTGDVQSAWDKIIAEQPERTMEVLQAELDAIDKERIALDVELGEFPARYPDIRELIPSVSRTAPLEVGKVIPVPAMAPRDLALGTSPGWQEPYPLPRTVVEGGAGDLAIDYPDTLGVPSGRYARERLASAGQKVLAPGERWREPPPQFPSQVPFLGEISQREADVAGIIPRIEKPILPTDDMSPRTISTLPSKLQEALTTGEGVADAFIAAQQAKVLAEAGDEDKIKKSILDKVYDWGGALPSAKEIVEKAQDILDSATTPEVLAALDDPFRKEGVDVETDFDDYARAQQAQQLAAEYGDIYAENIRDFPSNIGLEALGGSQTAFRESPSWEERYPLAPQEWGVDDAGLADRQWIDPHPLAINVDLGEYYKIPPDQRDKIYKPPESRWDVSRSGGSVWDRERRAAIEGRGMVDEFGEIQEKAEQDAIEKTAFDRWLKDIQTDRYVAEKDLEGEYGPHRLEEVWTSERMPAPIVAETTGGEDAPIDLLDKPPFLPVSDPRSRYGVGGNVQEFMYNGERWYLTKQGEYAKQYKRSELVTPWQSLPADFF